MLSTSVPSKILTTTKMPKKFLIEKCPNVLTTLDKNAFIFVLKTGIGNNKVLFWAKIFNVFNPIQHDLTSLNFITLLNLSESFSNCLFFTP